MHDDALDIWPPEEHECAATDKSELKFNGGHPVLLCGVDTECRKIVQYEDGSRY